MPTPNTVPQTRPRRPRRANATDPAVAPSLSPSPPTTPLAQFKPLPEGRNPNRHTERGLRMLEDAIQQDGYVAPMTATADGTIIDGNARLETVAHALPADPIIVEHDGTRPIVAIRTDIPSADDPRAQRIIVGANRIAEADLDWDVEVIKRITDEGALLGTGFFSENEMIAHDAEGRTTKKGSMLDNAVQLRPSREFVVVMCDEGEDGMVQFESLRERLGLTLVRRGGYRRGSPLDDIGVQRVVTARLVLEKMT